MKQDRTVKSRTALRSSSFFRCSAICSRRQKKRVIKIKTSSNLPSPAPPLRPFKSGTQSIWKKKKSLWRLTLASLRRSFSAQDACVSSSSCSSLAVSLVMNILAVWSSLRKCSAVPCIARCSSDVQLRSSASPQTLRAGSRYLRLRVLLTPDLWLSVSNLG